MTIDYKKIRISDLQRSAAANFYLEHESEKATNPIKPRQHNLPTGLLISLTSYGKRLETLHLTLKSLAEQTVEPDRIIVWLTGHDLAILPERCRTISPSIEFAECRDLRSYKKLIPALDAYPECTIVTVDDDAYYHRAWLEQLTENHSRKAIRCHIAYRYHWIASALAPYEEWTQDVQDAMSRRPSTDLLPIGIGGVLYPPRSLHPDTIRADLFEHLCPGADDLWFCAMAQLVGTKIMKVGPRLYQVLWPKTQEGALWRHNLPKNNDACLIGLRKYYGKFLFKN